MERCHICDEKAAENTCLILDGRDYPLCALHGNQAGDYLVTMLQGWLHDRPVKTPEKGKR